MTQEQKAKAYDEALEIARQYWNDRAMPIGTNFKLERMFPELKESESEDEKLREQVIYAINQLHVCECTKDKLRVWLEKQGEQKSANSVIEGEKPLLEKFKQAVYDCAWGKVTCKKEGETKEEYANRWAEQFLLIVRDWADDYIDFTIQQKLRNSYEKGKTDIIEKLHEQNLADKIEPKFKVGNWIICYGNEPLQIISIIANAYYEMSNGDILPFYMIDNDHNIRLWTIQDAKEGDVLCCESGWTCIFKALDNHTDTFSSYCFRDSHKWFCDIGGECHTLDGRFTTAYNGKISPATKEQRDTFMKAMADTGYTFDFEKKELKEI